MQSGAKQRKKNMRQRRDGIEIFVQEQIYENKNADSEV